MTWRDAASTALERNARAPAPRGRPAVRWPPGHRCRAATARPRRRARRCASCPSGSPRPAHRSRSSRSRRAPAPRRWADGAGSPSWRPSPRSSRRTPRRRRGRASAIPARGATSFSVRPGRRPPRATRSVQRRVGGLAGQPQHRDLTGVLDLTQRLHGARRARPTPRCRRPPSAVRRTRRRSPRGSRSPAAAPRQRRRGRPGGAPQARSMTTSASGDCCRGLSAVTPVGGQHRRVVARREPAARRWNR